MLGTKKNEKKYINTLELYQGLGHSNHLKVVLLLLLLLLVVPGQVFCHVPAVFDIIDY